jgi:hypothetical protein
MSPTGPAQPPPFAPPLLSVNELAARNVEGRLLAVAGRFAPELRERVQRLLVAAAEAIHKLADIDLIRQESGAEAQTSHSIAVWEELAPVMYATVESTNALCATAADAFPPPPETDPLDNLDEAFGPDLGAPSHAASEEDEVGDEQDIALLVAAVSGGLKGDVARLGERLRNPAVMADPWHLISDLLEFRGRLRSGIAELIFQVASRVGEEERALVVPGYQADLDAAVLVRAAATNLAFLFRGHNRRITAAPDERVHPALLDALKDLASFARTRALTVLRTADKRIFLESRAKLMQMSAQSAPAREIRQAIEGMTKYLDSLSVISRRDNLRLHDRTALAGAGRLVEVAMEAARGDEPARSRMHLSGAVRAAWSLYGRDPLLDSWLRQQRHFPVEWLNDGELPREAERLAAHLGGIAFG